MHNGRNKKLEKAKDFKKSMKSLINYCRPFLIPIIISTSLAIASSILSIIGPDKLKDITNIITKGLLTGIDINDVKKVSIVLLIMYLFSAMFGYVQESIMATVTNKFSKNLRKVLISKILVIK